jgi:predicted RNA binding protein YcfA (HicA-like mRNA interferase family)
LKVRDVIRQVETDGWYLDRVRGSHRQYRHFEKPGVVTIPGKPGDDLTPGTLRSVWRQAQIDPRRNR